jgi:NAD-dependent SIR2 family protein deacetylase
MQDSCSADSLLSRSIKVAGDSVKVSTLFKQYKKVKDEELAGLNALMARLRINARHAPLGKFHEFLRRAIKEEQLLLCLTRNFDGLETRYPDESLDLILRMHGDNREMRCSSLNCPGVGGQRLDEFDDRLLDGELVECPHCSVKGEL